MPNFEFRGKRAPQALAVLPASAALPAHSTPMDAYFAKRKAAALVAKANAFQPSPQQQAFFDWIADGAGSLILRAAAGCGKTTTLIEALRLMQGDIFFGAYNKDIAAEIKAKATKAGIMRAGLFIATMHGAGFRGWTYTYKNSSVDDGKVRRIVDSFAKDAGNPTDRIMMARTFICALVSFGKQFLIGVKTAVDNAAVWAKLADHFSVDQSLPGDINLDEAIAWAIEVYKRSHTQCPQVIDFDDMLYAPIAYNNRIIKNDWVLIDEAQDMNPARREYAARMLKPGGRLVAVGDDRQAIYGFTGSGGNAIELIKDQFKCAELPLSVTYRCPQKVVEFLHQFVPVEHITAHPSAPEGEVRPVIFSKPAEGTALPWYQQDLLKTSDVILCRYNAPLLTTAFAMIRDGIACKVAGRDIGKGLITLARTWKITKLTTLRERLAKHLEQELIKAAKLESERRAQEITDKVDCLYIFIERCQRAGKQTIDELEAEIEAMFADTIENMITLSSVHKAKGKEWSRVYWLQTALRGRPKKEWEAEQEVNLSYVCASRVKAEAGNADSGVLVLVPEQIHSPKG